MQRRRGLNMIAARGVAVCKYPSDIGPMDYALFIVGRPCCVIKCKGEVYGQYLIALELHLDPTSLLIGP